MNKSIIFGIIVVILFAAIFTNPNQERHKEVVKTKLNEYVRKSTHDALDKDGGSALGEGIASLVYGSLIDQIVNNSISTDNYVVFSITNITFNGETKPIGFGVFGNVFLSDNIKEALDDKSKTVK